MRSHGFAGAARAVGIAACLAALAPRPAGAQGPLDDLVLTWEGGPVAVLKNDLRFGEQGTRYTGDDVNQDNLSLAQRVSAELRFGERHGLVLSWIPLELVTSARLPGSVRFNGETFAAGTAVVSTYRFDGYRAAWLYRAVVSRRLSWEIGGALQVRAAVVQLAASDGSRLARESNVGPVPALATRLAWRFRSGAWTRIEATGLYTFSGKGGLYDAAWTVGAPLAGGRVHAFGGLRFYGGGADVSETYNFADFAFALAGVQLHVD